MGTPKKTNSGWTQVEYIGKDTKGKKRYKRFTAKTRKELELKVGEFKKETDGHDKPQFEMTVGDAVDEYIRARDNSDYSPKTIREYKVMRRNGFQGIVNVKLYSLNDRMIQEEINRAAENRSPKTISLWWGLFGSAIRKYRKGYVPDVVLPSVRRKPVEVPNEGTLKRMFAELDGDPREVPILLAAVCGMRRGEISALDLKNDVDYEKGTIRIDKAYSLDESNSMVLKEPKTEAGKRTIFAPNWVIERLKKYRDSEGFKMYSLNQISDLYRTIREKYNLPCTFHGLRHYYASVMLALGVPDKYAMERMGHSTNSMLKHYQESIKEKELEIDGNMMEYFTMLDEKEES